LQLQLLLLVLVMLPARRRHVGHVLGLRIQREESDGDRRRGGRGNVIGITEYRLQQEPDGVSGALFFSIRICMAGIWPANTVSVLCAPPPTPRRTAPCEQRRNAGRQQ
jgi:hypothetical protein